MPELRYLRGNGMELAACRQSMISYPLHNHVSVFTIGFVMDGAIELAAGREARVFQRGDAFVLGPYMPHRINAKSRYELLSLCIDKELIAQTGPAPLESMAVALLRQAMERPAVQSGMLQTLRSSLQFCRTLPARQETELDGLRERLELHPEIPCRVEEMAALAFTSKYHLIRAFKREVGLSPHQFQIQNRVRKARKLLRGSASFTEVALAAGFFDQSHFIRCFEKIVGVTPGAYKRACGTADLPPPRL